MTKYGGTFYCDEERTKSKKTMETNTLLNKAKVKYINESLTLKIKRHPKIIIS